MKHFEVGLLLLWTGVVVNWGSAVWLSLRNLREWRIVRAIRLISASYELELLERGVTLPPRCIACRQVLPRHVDGCPVDDHLKDDLGRVTERLTRPPIKYDPTGRKPPEMQA